jgi:hypothetical protein
MRLVELPADGGRRIGLLEHDLGTSKGEHVRRGVAAAACPLDERR